MNDTDEVEPLAGRLVSELTDAQGSGQNGAGMLKTVKTCTLAGCLLVTMVVADPKDASAVPCSNSVSRQTGAQQSSGTSQYYGGWLNLYNENNYVCAGDWTYQYLQVTMSNQSIIQWGFAQPSAPTNTSYFFSVTDVYPSGGVLTYYGAASTARTYSIRAYSSSIAGIWILDETAGSTFTEVADTPDMGKDTGVMSGEIEMFGGDAALRTNWSDTQNRYNGGWGYWTNEICAADSNISDWKVNFGTIGDFYTSNFTHSGAC